MAKKKRLRIRKILELTKCHYTCEQMGQRTGEDQVHAEESSQLCVSGQKEELNPNLIKILNLNPVFSNGKFLQHTEGL